MSEPTCRIRLAAAPNLVYLPHHLGISQGHFSAAGVDVEIVDHEAGRSDITDLVISGEADIVLGSLVYAYALSRRTPAAIVAISNQQTRHFLFQRTSSEPDPQPFAWTSLRGRVIVVEPTTVPTSWVAFVAALRRQGLGLDDVPTLVGYTPHAVLDEFLAGAGDYFLGAIDAVTNPGVRVVSALAEPLGPLPWSVYCARRDWVLEHNEAVHRFRDGLADALRWLGAAALPTATDAAMECFPLHDRALVETTIDHYRRIAFWAADPVPRRDDIARWESYLQEGGLLPLRTNVTEMLDATTKEGA